MRIEDHYILSSAAEEFMKDQFIHAAHI